MTDWPRIRTDVDDDRPARRDEVEYCESCGRPVLDGELVRHAGLRCCEDCRHYCPICHDWPTFTKEEFCVSCALEAMGVEL